MANFFFLARWRRATHPLAAIGLLLATAGAAQAQTMSYAFTGGNQTYTVPAGVTAIQVVATGASVGGGSVAGYPLAYGARVQATVLVTPGEVLTVVVGGQGNNTGSASATTAGGFNGGGASKYDGSGGRLPTCGALGPAPATTSPAATRCWWRGAAAAATLGGEWAAAATAAPPLVETGKTAMAFPPAGAVGPRKPGRAAPATMAVFLVPAALLASTATAERAVCLRVLTAGAAGAATMAGAAVPLRRAAGAARRG